MIMTLIHGFAQGRHEWVELEEEGLKSIERYLRSEATGYCSTAVDLARKGSVAVSAWSANSASRVTVTREHLDHMVEDLSKPAVLVVENLNADGGFVTAVCGAFREQRILRALENHWLEIMSGGGSTIVMVAESCAKKFRHNVRVVTLLDSDRLYPDHSTDSHVKAEKLSRHCVKAHVLELREAENYLPNCLLAAMGTPATTARRLEALKRLSPEQRGYFDMKYGFGKEEKPQKAVPLQRRELYADVPEDVRRAVHDGFGHDVITKAVTYAARLSEQDFEKLGVAAELRKLLATINTVI